MQVQMAQMLAAHQAARSSQGPAVQQTAGPAPQPVPDALGAGQQAAQGAATQQPGVGTHIEPSFHCINRPTPPHELAGM